MKRRSFLSLSALSAMPAAVATAAEENSPSIGWHTTVDSESLKFRAVSVEGKLILNVALIKPAEDEVTEAKDEKGEFHSYRYKGKDVPYPFHPGSTLLTRFDLTWDGKAVPIPERFWSDLAGLDIETSTLDPSKLKPELRWEAQEFLEKLRRPRVMLSAEGGTALIEWVRAEECDARSTIRWIIGRSGTVLRHRHEPPHEC